MTTSGEVQNLGRESRGKQSCGEAHGRHISHIMKAPAVTRGDHGDTPRRLEATQRVGAWAEKPTACSSHAARRPPSEHPAMHALLELKHIPSGRVVFDRGSTTPPCVQRPRAHWYGGRAAVRERWACCTSAALSAGGRTPAGLTGLTRERLAAFMCERERPWLHLRTSHRTSWKLLCALLGARTTDASHSMPARTQP